MLQTKNESLTTTRADVTEIRRRIGIGLMVIAILTGMTVNTLTLLTNLSFTTSDLNFTGYITAGICGVGLFMLYRKFFVDIALHAPIALTIALLVMAPSDAIFAVTAFSMVIYASVVARFQVLSALCVFTIIMAIIRQINAPSYPHLVVGIMAVALGIIVFYVIHNFISITLSATRTNRLLQVSANIAQVINRELELQQLMDTTVNIIRDEFDFYHVQIFLTDSRQQYANLIASTGDAGKQLLARNHRLPVGSQSVIGRVTQVGEPVVAQNTEEDMIHAINELLPDTRAELALPIIESGNIIGALDVQSVNRDAFQEIDVQALQVIANQIAVAIHNARLFDQAQQNIQENKRLLFEYETNLREVDRLNRTLTKQSWDNYIIQSYVDGVTLSKDRFVPQAEWSDAMQHAITSHQPYLVQADETNLIAIPITLRGQSLGAIEIEVDPSTNLADSIEMIEAISQRLAISLESARLFEETQEASLQEQQINEIVSSYETAVTIDELLQITLEKLQQALGAEEGAIRLGIENGNGTSSHTQNGNGGSPS